MPLLKRFLNILQTSINSTKLLDIFFAIKFGYRPRNQLWFGYRPRNQLWFDKSFLHLAVDCGRLQVNEAKMSATKLVVF